MSAHSVIHSFAGEAAVTLHVGAASLTVLPDLAMLASGFTVAGEPVVALHRPLEDYVRDGHTLGVPLLHPWANRLGASRFELDGTDIDLANVAGVTRDPSGLPMHGLLLGRRSFDVELLDARGDQATLSGRLRFDDRLEAWRAFPFDHDLVIAYELSAPGAGDARLEVTVVVEATGSRTVPISFGWHPFLGLGGSARDSWELELPERDHLELDERQLPTGLATREPAERLELAGRSFDDSYRLVSSSNEHRRLVLRCGDSRVAMAPGEGYDYVQVFGEPGMGVVALEPMVAATDALRTGEHPWIEPGDSYEARFAIEVSGVG